MDGEIGLLSLLQISDLHLHDQIGGRHVGPFDAQLPFLLSLSDQFDGLLGHHYKALSALDAFCRRLGADEPFLLTVTGDLTANGGPAQFALIDWFLSAQGTLPNIGLGVTAWPDLSVPGNHDHWPGTNKIFGGPTASLRQFFPGPYPILPKPLQLADGSFLRFILVNSDEDVSPISLDRLYARGSFLNQLISLETGTLPACPDNEVRVLIVHHSMMPTPPQGPAAPTSICEITPPTRQALDRFLVDADIGVVLCGHRHIARLSHLTPSNGVQTVNTLESRCGTTTQLDKYPYAIAHAMRRHRTLPPNTLVMHRLVQRSDGLYWKAQIHWLSKSGQFVTGLSHVSCLLPSQLATEIKVLPRP